MQGYLLLYYDIVKILYNDYTVGKKYSNPSALGVTCGLYQHMQHMQEDLEEYNGDNKV